MGADVSLSGARLAADPELKFLPSGRAALNARVAVNHRQKDPQTGEWKDAGTTWLTLVAYGQLAEEAAEHLRRGDMVTGSGELRVREYEKDGEKRLAPEVILRHVGRDLVFARNGNGQQQVAGKGYDEPPFLKVNLRGTNTGTGS